MATLYHRTRSNANASLISMAQRFSDVVIIFLGLYLVCLINSVPFEYQHALMSLLSLVIFQMIGGITDFYRSWRGVAFSTEYILIFKNWTLSLLIALGLLSLDSTIDTRFLFFIQWYLLVDIGFFVCRSVIRLISGLLRKFGYNTRRVAVVGSLPAGINLLKSFIEQPWLGFVVKGIYDNIKLESAEYDNVPYAGNIDKLIQEAREGKIDRIYIAMSMRDESKIKDVVRKLTDTTCSVLLIPDIFTFNILQSRTEEINGVPVVPLFDSPLNG